MSKLTPDVAGDYLRLKDPLLHEFKLSPNTYLERLHSCRKNDAENQPSAQSSSRPFGRDLDEPKVDSVIVNKHYQTMKQCHYHCYSVHTQTQQDSAV